MKMHTDRTVRTGNDADAERRRTVPERDMADSGPRVVTVEPFDERGTAVVVDGELDLLTAPQLRDAIAESIADGHRHLVIDLTGATFVDSMAMGTLLSSLRPLHTEPDAAVALAGAQGMVHRSLTVSGIDQMFSLFDDRAAAISLLGKAPASLRDLWRYVGRRPYPSA
jgi:anti-sigma B factor antagonist